MEDRRSYKVVIVPDYALNPENYPHLPQHLKIYEGARDAGYGVIKMPPTDIPEESADEWVEITADMIEEYLNKGYKVAVIAVEGLPDKGVWFSKLVKELESRRTMPKILEISRGELEADGEQLAEKIKTVLS